MISFNRLGNLGHLGNQMFQYASTKGIATKNNTEFYIPETKYFGTSYNTLSNIDDCFEIKCNRGITNFPQYIDPNFQFDENLFNISGDMDLLGYFQSEKYFKHIENQIKEDFVFDEVIFKECFAYRHKRFSNTPLISVHIRRTDYLTDTKFENLDIDYYYDALKLLPKFPVLIFSDDIEWCKENIKFENSIVSPFKNHYFDLCMMTMCDYHIIANSSFSWWGSWLGNSEQTIAPKKWFCGEFSNLNTKDLYRPDWITI
jgi:hypothetical protein